MALRTHSAAPEEAVRQSLERSTGCWPGLPTSPLQALLDLRFHPGGNMRPVAEAWAERLDAAAVVVCPAFPRAGRRFFMGHLFVGDRLLSKAGMEQHPLNPP